MKHCRIVLQITIIVVLFIVDISNLDNLPNRMRIRSNSADSWVSAMQGAKHGDNESIGDRLDVITKEGMIFSFFLIISYL